MHRPAKDALIEISVSDGMLLCVPFSGDEDDAEFVVPPDLADFNGAVTARVHAENLSSIAEKTIGVQIRRSTASLHIA